MDSGRVYDFNFKPLIVALDWLVNVSDELNDDSDRPALVVQLSISEAWCRAPSMDSHAKWCKWVRNNSKAGIGITVDYQIEEVEDAAQTYKLLGKLVRGEEKNSSFELVAMFRSFENWHSGDVRVYGEETEEELVRMEEEIEREFRKYRVPDPGMVRS